MKLNNKGFAISTVLYGLLALVILIIMLIFQVMRTSNNNSKALGQSITEELNYCRTERVLYQQMCADSNCKEYDALNECLKEYQCNQMYSIKSSEYSTCVKESE